MLQIKAINTIMDAYDLNIPIFKIGKEEIPWTIGNSFEGLQIFGGIGSGKTSGSGRFFALKFLSMGYGGLVLTVKPDEKSEWVEYCKNANRLNDLVIVEPNGKHYFNFLDYESRNVDEKSYTENILQVLKTVIRASEEKGEGKSDDQFWESALDMLITNTIDLCLLAYNKITVQDLYSIARSATKFSSIDVESKTKANTDNESPFAKALKLAKENVRTKIINWTNDVGITALSKMTDEEYNEQLLENVPDTRTLMFIDEFFTETYAELSDKTRSIIDFSFIGFLFRLLKDPVYSLFCNKPSTFIPEDCLVGKIIIINLPVKIHHKVGRDIQIMFKYIWQRAMEKRNVKLSKRPVFLWADEAQNFLHEYDPDYQATARSSRIATVYISQNIPNYYANMGGIKSEPKVKSFLGTLATKIFHTNADIETNKYASELIGEHYQDSLTESTNTVDGKVSITKAISLELRQIVRPEGFQSLLSGGAKHDGIVTGYIHVQGLTLKERHREKYNHALLLFRQNYNL